MAEDDAAPRGRRTRALNSISLVLRQFLLILGKNFLLQIRRPIGTVFELLLPFLSVVVIIAFRFAISAFSPEDKCFVTFPSDPLTVPKYSLTNIETIYYAPNTTKAQQIASYMDQRINALEDVAMIVGVATQEEFEVLIDSRNDSLLESYGCFSKGAGLYFEELDGPDIKYTIRLRHDPAPDGTWYTNNRAPTVQPRGARVSPNSYLNEGFMQLQKIVDESIIQLLTNTSHNIDITVRQFPYPSYVEDRYLEAIDFILPLLMVLSFIYSAGVLVKELVLEKETRIRETMRMMGLSNWVLVSTWFIKQLLFYLVPIIIMTLLLKYGEVFPRSDVFLIFVFLIFYVASGIAFCFFISVWFSSARIGLMAGFIIWFISYFPYLFMAQQYENIAFGIKLGTCLISNTCVGFGVAVISILELRQDGMVFSNFATPISLDDSLHMGWIILMLFIDTVIYMVLYWYIDAVKPGTYGIARPFYFIFQPSYWCGSLGRRKVKPGDSANLSLDSSAHEAEPTNLEIGISVKGLTKIYNKRNAKRRKVAVDNFSLNMYKGQITALLGHNGAGKTTTMSILTGLFSATAGGAEINGYDISTEMDLIRRSLGICPQHNVLFDRLTVREHLAFFAMLKGLPTKRVGAEVDKMIEDLQLADKRTVQSQKLSGGMKRKLSVGIALVGGSEVVILDEPTSGMDPYARRATWDLLIKHKEGRTMLLTTHFMDEADLLGDRIAIMAEGKLKCSGSSLFLKGRYGIGYHMTIVKEPECDSLGVTDVVTQIVTGAKQVTDVGAELSFILPSSSVKEFPVLFDYLDSHKAELGISSFGVSVTTMEEVFIKVGEGTDETLQSRLQSQEKPDFGIYGENDTIPPTRVTVSEEEEEETVYFDAKNSGSYGVVFTNKGAAGASPFCREKLSKNDSPSVGRVELGSEEPGASKYGTFSPSHLTALNTGLVLWFQQFYAMFLKRLYNAVRFWVSIIWQFIIPLAFVLWGLILGKTLPGFNSDDPVRALTIGSSSGSENRTFFWAQFGHVQFNNSNATNINFDIGELKDLGITDFFNYTEDINKIKESVRTLTSAEDCCGYKYQILDKFCATRGVNELYIDSHPQSKVCKGNTTFGYRPCAENCLGCADSRFHQLDSCTNPQTKDVANLITGGNTAENNCPLPPEVTYDEINSGGELSGSLDDYNVYVAEKLLRLSGDELNTNDFFLRFQGGFVVQPATPLYSVCGCNSPIPPSCDSLSPSLLSSFNLTRISEAYSSFANISQRFLGCFEAFPDSFNADCDQEWNYAYNWMVENCVSFNCPSSCEDDPHNCFQYIGAVSQSYPPASSGRLSATVWYNNQPYHMAPAVLNGFYNVLLRQTHEFRDYTITVSNDPLPRSLRDAIDDAQSEFLGFTISSTSLFGLSFMFASFIITLVQEKDSKAKHLQFVSGVSATSYWLSTFVFDLLNALIPSLLTLVLFAAFDIKGYQGENLGAIFFLLLLGNWAAIPLSYMLSFLFSNALIAFALMIVFYYFGALIFQITVFVLQASNKRDTAETLHYIFLLHPTYALVIGLADMYTNQGVKEACTQSDMAKLLCERNKVEYADSIFEFEKPAVGHIFIYMIVEGFIFLFLTVLIERSFFIPEFRKLLSRCTPSKLKRNNDMDNIVYNEDDDVAAERRKVTELQELDDKAVVIKNLNKLYRSIESLVCPCFDSCQTGNKLAVNQINLIIPSGECFGLLGVNGAGKTTTFKMLTGDISPSSGTATIAGFDIRTQLRLVQQRIGYCPQFDAILNRLTGRELLTMFARLRGIPERKIKSAVQTEIDRLDLGKYANKRCGTYSGGNKRKLSTAVALVGDPPILLLDEPTTGMDPATRRFLWDTLTSVIREGRSVILTSHSMEECEALCTRLAIMVNGQFKCLGSIQHLKSKFGSGYTLQIKVLPSNADSHPTVQKMSSLSESATRRPSSPGFFDTRAIHKFINDNFPGSLFLEEHQGSVTYRVPDNGTSWSSIFRLVEDNKECLGIVDYSVSQTTLDQVFINFAKEQDEVYL